MVMNQLLDAACTFYQRHLTDEHRQFLRDRYGFHEEFAERMRIGYAPPDGTALLMHLMNHGHKSAQIIASGLCSRWEHDGRSGAGDLLRGRIVFPYLDANGKPLYFIGRATPETPAYHDTEPAKYKKQVVTDTGPKEPIFGFPSVKPGEPLIITEGITDAMIVQQAGWPCISPVTTRFKAERIDDAAEYCRPASAVYIINDNEESGAGLQGATKTALALMTHGILPVYIGTIPRPDGTDKVDLNDYLRSGGNLDALIRDGVEAEEHPAVREERRRQRQQGMTRLRSALARERWVKSGAKKKSNDDIEDLKARMPSLSQYTGILPGERGAHPVYGSTHGNNFLISKDGETWTSFHGGNEQGKSGNLFKIIALEQGFLTDESMRLIGEAFKQTLDYCRERW